MTKALQLLFASLLALSTPFANIAVAQETPSPKRATAPSVPPIVLGELRIEALQYGKSRGLPQNGGYIVAIDRKSGLEAWILKVYEVPYASRLESDVQDVFIKRMRRFGKRVQIVDEKGRVYLVDVKRRLVSAD